LSGIFSFYLENLLSFTYFIQMRPMGLIHMGSPEKRVTVSLGVAANRSAPVASGAELLRSADHALYRGRASGRNRVALAN
jgi:PleD family two-component response regulator